MITFEVLGENKQMMIFLFLFSPKQHTCIIWKVKHSRRMVVTGESFCRTPGEAGLEKAMWLMPPGAVSPPPPPHSHTPERTIWTLVALSSGLYFQIMCLFSWPLNTSGLEALDSLHGQKSTYSFGLPQKLTGSFTANSHSTHTSYVVCIIDRILTIQ